MRKCTLFTWLLVCASIGYAQTQNTFRLYLIGDAGKDDYPYQQFLAQQLADDSIPSAIVFLGDNIYPQGLRPGSGQRRLDEENSLRKQVMLAGNGRWPIYFVPGNHDWAQGRPGGWVNVQQQQLWLDSMRLPSVQFLPKQGCPGPVEIPLNDEVTLLILDTQWFLHPWEKPTGTESLCESKTEEDVYVQLQDVLVRNKNKQIVVAAHHPLITYGEHGGYFSWKDHLFPLTVLQKNLLIPLPVVGSLYPLYRKVFGNIQDVRHPIYRFMATRLQQVLRGHSNIIYAAGHEHTLQYSQYDGVHYIVSGAGAKTSRVKKGPLARFVRDEKGYARITFTPQGNVLEFFSSDERVNTRLVYSQSLPRTETQPVSQKVAVGKQTTLYASQRYQATPLHELLLGRNYRDVWKQPVQVPDFYVSQERGGLRIVQRGGGQQTLSLRLQDSIGLEFTLRSIEKFPEKAVPEPLRDTFAEDLVQDQISAAHPYGALVIPPLAEAAGIYHTNPRLVYVRDDAGLGDYRKDFANQLMLFEERPSGSAKGQPFFGSADKVVSTDKLLEKLKNDNDNKVDQPFTLRSRLFDLWIGDWDRHDDQWRWAEFDQKKGKLYRPIPRDRDQAFFLNEGVFPNLWSKRWALPKFQGFDYEIAWTPGFMYNGRYFDRSFLTELSREQWMGIARELQESITDEVIENAIHQWPAEIYQHRGEEIIAKLKTRRDQLAVYALEHYLFLAKEVDVVGSDKKEWFLIEQGEGKVTVKIFKYRDKDAPQLLYQREFPKDETNEVRLYGQAGDDVFELKGQGRSAVRIRIIGGEGNDRVINETSGKPWVYDLENQITIEGKYKDETSSQPDVNKYDRKAFVYDRLAPLLYANANIDDGLFLGGGIYWSKQAFRKSPFQSKHVFLGSYAINTSSYNFKYDALFTDAIRKWDLLIDADVKSPNYVNNFFGMGNESRFDRSIADQPGINVDNSIQYYRLRFKEYSSKLKLAHPLGSWGYFRAGPLYHHIEIEDTKGEDRFINEYNAALPNSVIEKPVDFAGALVDWGVEKVNDPLLTSRGIRWNQTSRYKKMIGEASDFWSHSATLSFYQTFRLPAKVTFALRAGGGFNSGHYAFNLAQVLDGKTELRGFRKTRFYGDKKLYFNNEVRVKLTSIRSYLFPASIGVLGFYDTGRVWYEDESGKDPSAANGKSTRWHKGYGAGFWFTPFNATVTSLEVGHSNEGFVGYLRLGFLF